MFITPLDKKIMATIKTTEMLPGHDDFCMEFLKGFRAGVRAMETIKCTIQLVFLPAFCVAAMGTYFNMLPLPYLETKQKSCVGLA